MDLSAGGLYAGRGRACRWSSGFAIYFSLQIDCTSVVFYGIKNFPEIISKSSSNAFPLQDKY